MRTRAELIGELRAMLEDLYVAKREGESNARLARAHGYIDGYMRGLLETGVLDQAELAQVAVAAQTAPARRSAAA